MYVYYQQNLNPMMRKTLPGQKSPLKNKFPQLGLFLLISLLPWMGCGGSPGKSNETEIDSTKMAGRALIDSADYDTIGAGSMSRYAGQAQGRVEVGAEVLINVGLDKLVGKNIGIVTNHTALVFDGTHLVDSLQSRGIGLRKVFAPEHGFRGTADAGEHVKDGIDTRTGLPIISLYGKNRKPNQEHLSGLDLVIFDIQDVGTRFYTYISTMSYVMEACAEQGVDFMVLDRPNPNGWYVDGPMLEPQYSSFIGLHEIPIVHGMTVGEYATMVNAEGWLKGGIKVNLEVVKQKGYSHAMHWDDTGRNWISPSPNLATEYSAYLYAAICWFEPTEVSVGRGTHDAFTMLGAPWYSGAAFGAARTAQSGLPLYGLNLIPHSFTPVSLPGKSKYPKHQDKLCNGMKFEGRTDGRSLFLAGIALMQRFMKEHKDSGNEKAYFHKGFEKWPGYSAARKQLASTMTPEEIYASWQEKTDVFRAKRKQYLLYPDF